MIKSIKRKTSSLFEEKYDIGLAPPTLMRTYKAICPMPCNIGPSTSFDSDNRLVFHHMCRKNLFIVQTLWRTKIKVTKLRNITGILLKKIGGNMKLTDIIQLIYKFL